MKVALTVAGSDSGGGAGIQADLKTFAARGVFGTSVLTAITAQNTVGVSGVLEVPRHLIGQQFDAVCTDFEVRAAKTGMLGSSETVDVVAEKIAEWKIDRLVVDPVMIAKSGDALLHESAVQALIEKILPLSYIVTPNLPEAEVLCGLKILNRADRDEAARRIWELGARDNRDFYVIVKGGHEEESEFSVDVLFDGKDFREYSASRIHSKNTHGTGCTFSAAICAELALGKSTFEAVNAAKEYITAAIAQAPQLGKGHGPLQHFPEY